jgi:hypothetical protein
METSLHAVEAGAMENGIEERAKLTYIEGKAYGTVTDLLSTPTEAYTPGRRGVVAQA